jgi:hypothetical protein
MISNTGTLTMLALTFQAIPSALADIHLMVSDVGKGLAVSGTQYSCGGVSNNCHGCNAPIIEGNAADDNSDYLRIQGSLCGASDLDLRKYNGVYNIYTHAGASNDVLGYCCELTII